MGLNKLLKVGEIPVLLIGFNRPEFLRDRIIELSRMPIRKLYISLDGGSAANQVEMSAVCNWAQERLKNIDQLEIIQHKTNLGLVMHITSTVSDLLKKYSHIIIVEDDVALADSFYNNIINGFNIQIENQKIGIVGGFSAVNLSNIKIIRNKWRESPYSIIWGWGCSSETWNGYNYKLNPNTLLNTLNESETWQKLSSFQKQTWHARFQKSINNPNRTWDIQLQYLSFVKNFVNIYPISALTKNVGYFDKRSTNTKERKPRWMASALPDKRPMLNKRTFLITKKIYNVLDSNLLVGDTKSMYWFKNLKNKL
jgi:hypothetical protein